MEIDKVQILIILEDSGAVNPGTGMTLKEIGKELNENSDHKYSQTTVNRKVTGCHEEYTVRELV